MMVVVVCVFVAMHERYIPIPNDVPSSYVFSPFPFAHRQVLYNSSPQGPVSVVVSQLRQRLLVERHRDQKPKYTTYKSNGWMDRCMDRKKKKSRVAKKKAQGERLPVRSTNVHNFIFYSRGYHYVPLNSLVSLVFHPKAHFWGITDFAVFFQLFI